ncbi:MAG: D-alanine--D-alanine ligase A [Bacteroidetes bacterium]|nr:MAG: D-alanine--D-alanine ligase A [Bacteroidota bacterium]
MASKLRTMINSELPKIAVLAGGYSGESVISIQSAAAVMENIDRTKFNPYLVRIDQNNWCVELEDNSKQQIDRETFTYKDRNGNNLSFDAIFIMVHGTPGEDGVLQEYFENIGLPFSTGSSSSVSCTFNKFEANNKLRDAGILVADSWEVKKGTVLNDSNLKEIVRHVKLPCFVKPNQGGSSLGVSRVESIQDINLSINNAFETGSPSVIVESLLDGREFSIGVIPGEDGLPQIMPITEIISDNIFFDYEAKYEGASTEITPAQLSSGILEKIQTVVKKTLAILECKGMVRVDIILVNGDMPAVLEVNSVPGFTKMSLLPQQLDYAGIKVDQIITRIISRLL